MPDDSPSSVSEHGISPLTPSDADLQDFPFMPLHVARLRDSDLAAEAAPEACWFAVLLWAASWHQLPAASLPDNEMVLTRLCGLGRDVKTFRKHREGALRGFIKCSDGRLYHPVVAELALDAWEKKTEYQVRRARRVEIARTAAEARWSKPEADADGMHEALPEASRTDASCSGDAMPKGTGTGTGRISTEAEASGADAPKPSTPIDLKAAIFASGVPLLVKGGSTDRAARSMLGKWRQTHGDGAVLDALSTAQSEVACDPVPFITRVLENRSGQRSRPRQVGRFEAEFRDPVLGYLAGGGDTAVG